MSDIPAPKDDEPKVTSPDKTDAKAEKKEEPVRYGIYGDALKKTVEENRRSVEIRAIIKSRKLINEKFPDKGSHIVNTEVLISNQGTIGGEPKFAHGPHKSLIPDEIMLFLTEEDIVNIRVNLSTTPIYTNGVETFPGIDDKIRQEIAQKIAKLIHADQTDSGAKNTWRHRF